jgi:hypothetical protein
MTNEGAIRSQRVEFAREARTGTFPTDPAFELYSMNITSLSWSPSPGVNERRGIGGPDIETFHKGPEEHELTVEYDLQRWLTDAAGDPNDAAYDGIARNSNNDLPNTHSVFVREVNEDVPASETVDGYGATGYSSGAATPKSTYLMLVGVGGRVDDVTLSGDPGSEQPVVVEISYMFEKLREYQVDQPDDSTLTVHNDSSSGVDVTLANADASTSETLTVAAGDSATTVATFDELETVALADEVDGPVTVVDDGRGEALAIVRGADHYDDIEGDRGTPPLGNGSHADALTQDYETILDDVIERPAGAPIAFEINSVEFSVSNDLDSREQIGTLRMGISAGNRTAETTATVVGPTESVQRADEALGVVGATLRWTLGGGNVQLERATLPDVPGVDKSEGEAAMSLDNTFRGETVTIDA